jgi:hypothetical protein
MEFEELIIVPQDNLFFGLSYALYREQFVFLIPEPTPTRPLCDVTAQTYCTWRFNEGRDLSNFRATRVMNELSRDITLLHQIRRELIDPFTQFFVFV